MVARLQSPRRDYPLSREDLEWAARMIQGEGGRSTWAATLWTMAQRFMLVSPERFPTFKSLIQAYSAPINPRYNPCSEADEARLPLECSEAAQARRAQLMSGPAPVEALAFVERWARGEIANPVPRAAHFAYGPQVVRCQGRQGADRCLEVVAKLPEGLPSNRQNWYATTPASSGWTSDYVKLRAAPGTANETLRKSGIFPMSLALLGAGFGLAAYWIARGGR